MVDKNAPTFELKSYNNQNIPIETSKLVTQT